MIPESLSQAAIIDYVRGRFQGVDAATASQDMGAPEVAWGDTFFTYDPEHRRSGSRWLPFATIVNKDYGDFDRLSNLNRPGVFRLNMVISKPTYEMLFGSLRRLAGGGLTPREHDFAAFDTLLPHPVFASQQWICVLNPGEETFHNHVAPLLTEAYELAVTRYRTDRRR